MLAVKSMRAGASHFHEARLSPDEDDHGEHAGEDGVSAASHQPPFLAPTQMALSVSQSAMKPI